MKTSNRILLTLLAIVITTIVVTNVILKIRVDKSTEATRSSGLSVQTDTTEMKR